MNTNIPIGSTVRYSSPQNEKEAAARFTLLEVLDGKADIQLICDSLIRPIERISISEIQLA